MVLRGSRVNKLQFIDVPADIPVGVVVGPGGSQCKELRAKHGVRCKADFDTRKVLVEGSREGVDDATKEIRELFHAWRVDHERDQQAAATIHKVAVPTTSEGHCGWRFEPRDDESFAADPSVKDCDYRLVAIATPGVENEKEDDDSEGEASTRSRPWIFRFDASFRQHMQEEVATIAIATVDPFVTVKLKIAFGLQCFAIPDVEVAGGKTLLWRELRALELHTQLKPRWSNMLHTKSKVVTDLLDELETQFDEATTFKTELVVYVNKRHGHKDDVSIKFRWERGEWVLVERKPIRIAHALYNIALDNDTAFRLRAYSRQAAPTSLGYEELVNGLEITTASAHDPFTTTVRATRTFPSPFHIRSFAVRETVTVAWRGLRFTISYMNAKRTHASLACRLLEDEDAADMAAPEAMQLLLDKVLAITTTEAYRCFQRV